MRLWFVSNLSVVCAMVEYVVNVGFVLCDKVTWAGVYYGRTLFALRWLFIDALVAFGGWSGFGEECFLIVY